MRACFVVGGIFICVQVPQTPEAWRSRRAVIWWWGTAASGWLQSLDALARNSWIQMRCRSWRISPATEGVESGTWKAARKAREKASRWRGDRALSCSWSWSAMAGSSRASGLAS